MILTNIHLVTIMFLGKYIMSANALAPSLINNSSLKALTMATLVAFGVALIALSAKIQVPFWPVPVTLQTLAVMGLAAAYGLRLGLATILSYLAVGYMGAPVFAGFAAGPGYFAGPTAGYLAGFVIAVAIVGYVADRISSKNVLALVGATLAGTLIIYALGAYWLGFVYIGSSGNLLGFEGAWKHGVQPFLLADIVKAIIASLSVPAISSLMKK